MGKYIALGRFLINQNNEEIRLTFDEIENILGFPLPESAKKHRPWWANDRTHVQAVEGWLNVGWQVKQVDLIKRKVTFVKNTEIKTLESIKKIKSGPEPDYKRFEEQARRIMADFFQTDLAPRKKKSWPKMFDLVSSDYRIVGDAKFLSLVRGVRIPPAKFATIAEHVWFLEKIDADLKFLVFGNDENVPREWLKRYGYLVDGVKFYFIDKNGIVKELEKEEYEEQNMYKEKSFEKFWLELIREFNNWKNVEYWSVAGRTRNKSFQAKAFGQEYILIKPEYGSLQTVPKGDFEIVYDIWEQYLRGDVKRYEIRNMTRFSSYIISLIHYMLA
ncbi:MAG: DUF7662 domain-containing protein [Candidatus Asgardarchaeia archaeon]